MFKIPLLFILQFLVINQYEAKPFLYNVASVLTSASSASSVPQNSENIADLRKSDRQVIRPETPLVEENVNGFTFNEDPQTNNGFVPSLIQKKVSKILRKFLYINMFANSGSKPTTTTDEDFDREKEEFDREFEQDYGKNNTSVNITGIHSVIDVVLPSNITEEISVHPNEIILFDENGIIEKRKEIQKITDTKKKNDRLQDVGILRFSPGDIGVFFTELFGSLVGLAYGAAAQFNRPTGGQNRALI
ncbi:uncharacterized protein LOC123307877 isoform X2 [Coccinella septempunctata]|uniref:uncharacterized protein LOC123307877 isoform X2 n=1 Tax=Coccinella septempunctata TaxID=41139 RepID=UPI001D086D55|nr:uncharacterized protein LOC123307877 isoform X2 [Coccinella septempunctata]